MDVPVAENEKSWGCERQRLKGRATVTVKVIRSLDKCRQPYANEAGMAAGITFIDIR